MNQGQLHYARNMSSSDLHRLHQLHDPQHPVAVALRCPACRHQVTLQGFNNVLDVYARLPSGEDRRFGQRQCPNPACRAHVFVVAGLTGDAIVAYPPELIDFDATGLPPEILASLQEAIACHSVSCYRAAAIMVRRTLEGLCHDRGATGPNLRERLANLGEKVILPRELLDGLQHLRLLGNDAAHIKAETYDEVGEAEVELALDVAKEVLKAVYQYRGLVDRLNALKRAEIES